MRRLWGPQAEPVIVYDHLWMQGDLRDLLWWQNPEERKKAASNKDGRRIQKEVMANVLVGVVTKFKVRQK